MTDLYPEFDMKCALVFTGHEQTRFTKLKKQFDKIRMDDVEYRWNPPNLFDQLVIEHFTPTEEMRHFPYAANATLGHYRIVKEAYERGAGSIFVAEDDVRFLPAERFREAVESMPSGYDIALFDYFRPEYVDPDVFAWTVRSGKLSDRWATVNHVRGMSCYSMRRNGMKWFLDRVESCFDGMKFRICDQYFDPGLLFGIALAVSVPHAAVQQECDGSGSGPKDRFYKEMGIDPSLYSEDTI